MSRTIVPMEKAMARELTHEVEPYHWGSQGLTVVRDGYDMDGTRIHFVLEPGYYDVVLCNAHVFSV